MFTIPFHIADSDNGGGIGPLLILAFWVVVAAIGWLSKVLKQSRDQRRPQGRPGPTPSRGKPRATVNDFLEQIRRMATGEASPEQPPAPVPREPSVMPPPPPRPVTPLQAKGAPPPPPRPRVQPAGLRPSAPPPPRPAVVRRPPAPSRLLERAPQPVAVKRARPSEFEAEPAAVFEEMAPKEAPPTPVLPKPSVSPAGPLWAGPPKRKAKLAGPREKLTVKPEPAKKAAPAPAPLAAAKSPEELRAALRGRLAAGPSALREAILLGEVLGRPIGMRRRGPRRPGPPSRLI